MSNPQNTLKRSGFGDMTLAELKSALRARNAKLSGRKQELVERLEAYERNFNFGNDVDMLPAYEMKTPEKTTYRDINTDSKVPMITEETVKGYLHLFDQKLQEKPKQMYQERFLQTIRMSKQGADTYVNGNVSAEMKKHVSYMVDVKIDEHSVIKEAQCECAVGMGPDAHCKHVALVLYAITKANEGIITKETCTQVLQTFHQTKQYKGSPVKMAELQLRKGNGLTKLTNFDPRPPQMRGMPEYPSLFRSIWLSSSGKDLPIRQLYEPANILGICHDHDYLKQTHEELFLDQMHITSINEEQRKLLELKTRGQRANKFWAEERTKRLHASNFGTICKATDRTNFHKLASSFTLRKDIRTQAILHGQKYEGTAIKAYCQASGQCVQESGIIVCQDTPYLACSPDGLVGSMGIIEVKCPFSAKDREINQITVPYLDLQDNELILKGNHIYYYQVMGTLACTGRAWCDFIVWTFRDMKIIHIKRDDEFIRNMKDKLHSFYSTFFRDCILAKFLYRNTDKYTFE